MKAASFWIALCLLPIVLPAEDRKAASESRRVLTGTYSSAFNDRPNRLRVTFVAADEPGRWKVTFDFSFNNRWRAWFGTAEGSFESGTISGVARNETATRVFTFRLERDKNRYKGTHFEVVGRRESKTGTLTLNG